MKAKDLREIWLNYYKEKGHLDVGSVSLIGDGETGVLFNVAGMQAIMPYLLGEKHPSGKTRLCNIQGCVRTVDIDEVGDNRHLTFFEMMGNWSLGDYFKKEKTKWSFELLTKNFGYDKNKICATVFEGDETCPRDEETAKYLEEAGLSKNKIYYLPKKNNWWDLPGTVNTPCGPDNEWFYETETPKCGEYCNPSCDCGHFVEIGNDVYMQFEQLGGGKYKDLKNKNVDTGFGFERNLGFLNNTPDLYKTDLFSGTIKELENLTGKKYESDKNITKAFRIIADHVRTSMMLLADEKLLKPSNVAQGYILRRLIRRAVRYANMLGLPKGTLVRVAKTYIEGDYYANFPQIQKHKNIVYEELEKEEEKFLKTLESGEKELNKLIEKLKQFAPGNKTISGDKAFRLFDTFGFPIEITKELASEQGFCVDEEGFNKAFERHRQISKATEKGEFKGGLGGTGEVYAKYHTATHLLLATLRRRYGENVFQRGSNITEVRMRFDFSLDKKLEAPELLEIEQEVNSYIQMGIPVQHQEMSLDEAKKSGALGIFENKYGDSVSVYKIGNVSHEICGGPHASNTKELGHFKILKEESNGAGVRRIKAVLN